MISKKLLKATLPAGLLLLGTALASPAQAAHHGSSMDKLKIDMIGNYRTGVFDESATEIVSFDPATKRLFAVNGNKGSVMVIDLADPTKPTLIKDIDLSKWGKAANSVVVKNGIVGAAVENNDKQANGNAVFFDTDGNYLNHVEVGALPDMINMTEDGKVAIVANEGEPSKDYTNDPEGSISLIDLSGGVKAAKHTLLDFKSMTEKDLINGLRLGSDRGTVAQNMEPEYVAISKDGKTAWVTLQENNGLAIVDIAAMKLSAVVGMGNKDHMKVPFDASNKDGKINIQPWPVLGMYQPDSAYSFTVDGKNYVAVANEGDARDYDGYSEETRVAKLKLDETAFPNAAELQEKKNLGRLKTTTANGDIDGDGDFDVIYSYGGRSFSILDEKGAMVFDSGSQFEEYLAEHEAENFNSTNDENGSFDDRSDDKGAEPEAITAGTVDGTPYVFVGLERFGGFFAYDVTNPAMPKMAAFRNDRKFDGDPKKDTAGELAPEGMTFIDAKNSPNGKPLLVVASEVSGSIAVYEVTHK